MRIAAICAVPCHWPYLGQLIHCFTSQTHDDRELVIVDDTQQYEAAAGADWQLLAVPAVPTLGARLNEAFANVGDDTEAVALWDARGLYMPWALAATAVALERAPWSRPGRYLHLQSDGRLQTQLNGGKFYGDWAVCYDKLLEIGRFPLEDELTVLTRKLMRSCAPTRYDPFAAGFPPFYVATRDMWPALGARPTLALGNLPCCLNDPKIIY